MYIQTDKNARQFSVAVSKEISWTGKKNFKFIPEAVVLNGKTMFAIQCGASLGSSAEGGILLPTPKDSFTKIVIRHDSKNNDHYIMLDGTRYYFSFVERIGSLNRDAAYWLVNNGETLDYYYGNYAKPDSLILKELPGSVFQKLMKKYPTLEPGSLPSFLYSLFPLCQNTIRFQQLSGDPHSNHAQNRNYFSYAASAMRETIENIEALLKK